MKSIEEVWGRGGRKSTSPTDGLWLIQQAVLSRRNRSKRVSFLCDSLRCFAMKCLTLPKCVNMRYCNKPSLCSAVCSWRFPYDYTVFLFILLLLAEINKAFDDTFNQDCLLSPSGKDYTGRHNRTASGASCQRWSVKYPHHHGYDDIAYFADLQANSSASMNDVSNYCRNPAISSTSEPQPWCYTTRNDSRDIYEFCDIPRCKG